MRSAFWIFLSTRRVQRIPSQSIPSLASVLTNGKPYDHESNHAHSTRRRMKPSTSCSRIGAGGYQKPTLLIISSRSFAAKLVSPSKTVGGKLPVTEHELPSPRCSTTPRSLSTSFSSKNTWGTNIFHRHSSISESTRPNSRKKLSKQGTWSKTWPRSKCSSTRKQCFQELPRAGNVGNIMIWGMGGVRTRSGRRAYTGWHVPDVPTIDLKIHLKSSLSRVRPIWSVC